jgi:glycosyltransferase involved in cell wall biosynthesis
VGESFWQTLDQKKMATRIKSKLFGIAKGLFLRKQDDERNYNPLGLLESLELKDKVFVVNDFVPNEEVHKYFQVSNNLLLFYLTATPSGVESIGYNFGLPMLATAVGHFPETIKEGYNGYLAAPDNTDDMAATMIRAMERPIPAENIYATSKDMSWHNYAGAIMKVFTNATKV